MARSWFGGTVADYLAASFPLLGRHLVAFASGTLTFWSAETGGTQYTDLLLNGAAATSITVDVTGQIPRFQGPDAVTSMWADAGGDRALVVTTDAAAIHDDRVAAEAAAASIDPTTLVRYVNSGVGIEKTDPSNARVYIGSGTGTLADNGRMGLKVKIDTPTGSKTDGIQADVKVTTGSSTGSVRTVLARVDVADSSATTGDSVALWGDAWITAPSARNAWGGNIYGHIDPSVAYPGALIGLEVGWENDGTLDNVGGGLHVVGKGTGKKAAFGVSIGSDPSGGSAATFRTNLMMRSDNAPSENYVWIGSAPSNSPSGTPLFQIDATGKIGIGQVAGTPAVRIGQDVELASTLSGTTPALTVKRASNTFPTMKIGGNGGAEIDFGNGTTDTDAFVARGGLGIITVSSALWVGAAAANGSGYMQLWEQSAAPGAPATNSVRLFAQDNGSGKTQLCVRFPTGSTIVLATEA